MFDFLPSDSVNKLGIPVHKLTSLRYEHGLVRGALVHNGTTNDYSLFVSPNLKTILPIAEKRADIPLLWEFHRASTHSIGVGVFKHPVEAKLAIYETERCYRHVLSQNGACMRFLHEDGESLSLVLDNTASNTRLGDAVIQAINERVFEMLESDSDLTHRNVVGRIMPAYLQALGFKEYHLSHDLSKSGFGKVRFVIKGHYAFDFYEPLSEGMPPYLERYRYREFYDAYELDSSSELTVKNLKSNVLDFIEGLARDLGYFDRQDAAKEAKEAAMKIRPIEIPILGKNAEKPKVLRLDDALPTPPQRGTWTPRLV